MFGEGGGRYTVAKEKRALMRQERSDLKLGGEGIWKAGKGVMEREICDGKGGYPV